MKGSGSTVLIVGILGTLAYLFFSRSAAAAAGGGFFPTSGARPFDVLSADPVITPGSTPGGYQPPVFGTPILAPPGANF